MFHKINEAYVVNDEGYKIKFGWKHLSYMEENKYTVTFDAEHLIEPHKLLIYIERIEHYWHPPHEREKLNNTDIYKIKNRISEALKFLKINFEIE